MPVWYDDPTIAHRLGHPFTYPGGPSAVAEPAAARRQTVQQFQEQASSAWQQLVATVEAGLQEQAEDDDDAGSSPPPAGLQDTRLPPLPQQMRTQQQQQQQQQQQSRQQQQTGLDLSGIAVPLLPRRRLTGPILLVPQPATTPPGMTPAQATAAAVAAARAAQPLNGDTLEALLVPAGCLQLSSWQESAAAEEPPGIVASSSTQPRRAAAAAGDAAGDVLAPGSEVVVTLVVMDTSRQLSSVQQEIQALGSNTLSELRDAISCPTDKLAEGLGASNAAAYFYIDQCFYDDTRAAAAAECSEVVKQWVHRFGFAGPKHLLRHYEPPEEPGAQPLLPLPAPPQQPLLPLPAPQQDQQQQAMGEVGGSGGQAASMTEQPPDEPMQEAGDSQQQPPQQQQDEGFAHLERQLALLEQQHQQHQQQHHQQQQAPPSRQMQHVTLRELVMQASNRPIALFSHQGLCEHAVLISDVRLLHAADPNKRSEYPRTVFQASLGRRLHCGVCKRVGATALMLDHPETPEAVIVLCRLCCGLFSVEQYPQAKLVMLEPFPFQHQQ